MSLLIWINVMHAFISMDIVEEREKKIKNTKWNYVSSRIRSSNLRIPVIANPAP